MTTPNETDFDDWLDATVARLGSFTVLIVLVEIDENSVGLLRSSYIHVIGNETRWSDMARLFAGAPWNGAAFFQADRAGLVTDRIAAQRLAALTAHLERDRSLIKHSEFFNPQGLRLRIEEIAAP